MMPPLKAAVTASSGPTIQERERAPRGSLFRVWTLLAVAAGGAVGGALRSLTNEVDAAWPWPTLVVNLAGAFLLGVAIMVGRRRWPQLMVVAVSVGVLGALTTFSTVAGELWDMSDTGHWEGVLGYATVSVAGGWIAAVAGLRLGRGLR